MTSKNKYKIIVGVSDEGKEVSIEDMIDEISNSTGEEKEFVATAILENYEHPDKPFSIFPNRDDIAGVAARAAMLRFADIIAHESATAAADLRTTVLDIEARLGRPTH